MGLLCYRSNAMVTLSRGWDQTAKPNGASGSLSFISSSEESSRKSRRWTVMAHKEPHKQLPIRLINAALIQIHQSFHKNTAAGRIS